MKARSSPKWMSTSDRSVGRRTGCTWWRAGLLCVIAAHAASAHPLAVTTGELRVDGDRLVVAMNVTPHDLTHAGIDSTDETAANAFADRLAGAVVTLDDHGAALDPAPASTGTRSWRLDAATRYVTLQLRPSDVDGLPGRQAYLRVFRAGDAHPAGVAALTGPGVAAVLDTKALRAPGKTDARPVLAPDTFRVGRIELHVGPDRVAVHVVLPAPLLDAWRLAPRQHPDTLTADEADQQAAALIQWLRAHLHLQVNGTPRAAQTWEPQWLAPGDAPRPGEQAADHSARCFASTRVQLTLSAKLEEPPVRVDLDCTAFNAAVLGLETRIVHAGDELLAGILTPHTAQMIWERRADDCLVRVGHREVTVAQTTVELADDHPAPPTAMENP